MPINANTLSLNHYPKDYLIDAIHKSIKNLWENQPDIATGFTEETIEHEPNLSFHIANEIWNYFPDLNCDFDVSKKNFRWKRPDIIFHKRGTHDYNYLVIEVKRATNRDVIGDFCPDDESKIATDWFSPPLKYRYGISLVIDENNKTCQFSLLIRTDKGIITERYHSGGESIENITNTTIYD